MRKLLRATILILAIILVGAVGLVLGIYRPFILSYSKKDLPITAKSERLRDTVSKLSKDLAPRDWRSLNNLNQTANYIRDEFQKSNSQVELQNYEIEGVQYSNIISNYGDFNSPVIVIGAHYDAFGKFPAADDNASGVAGVLELARLLKERPLKVPVSLVAYTLEEPPFFRTREMGSAQHADLLRNRKTPVRLMISLEMIGYFSDEKNSQSYPLKGMDLLYPSTGNFIAVVDKFNMNRNSINLKKAFLEYTTLPAYSMNAPSSLVGVDFSDHLNYWNAGYEAMMVTDTAFFRNYAYHTENDTLERLDFDRMAQVVNGVYGYLASLN